MPHSHLLWPARHTLVAAALALVAACVSKGDTVINASEPTGQSGAGGQASAAGQTGSGGQAGSGHAGNSNAGNSSAGNGGAGNGAGGSGGAPLSCSGAATELCKDCDKDGTADTPVTSIDNCGACGRTCACEPTQFACDPSDGARHRPLLSSKGTEAYTDVAVFQSALYTRFGSELWRIDTGSKASNQVPPPQSGCIDNIGLGLAVTSKYVYALYCSGLYRAPHGSDPLTWEHVATIPNPTGAEIRPASLRAVPGAGGPDRLYALYVKYSGAASLELGWIEEPAQAAAPATLGVVGQISVNYYQDARGQLSPASLAVDLTAGAFVCLAGDKKANRGVWLLKEGGATEHLTNDGLGCAGVAVTKDLVYYVSVNNNYEDGGPAPVPAPDDVGKLRQMKKDGTNKTDVIPGLSFPVQMGPALTTRGKQLYLCSTDKGSNGALGGALIRQINLETKELSRLGAISVGPGASGCRGLVLDWDPGGDKLYWSGSTLSAGQTLFQLELPAQ